MAMWFRNRLDPQKTRPARPPGPRLRLDALEDRSVPSFTAVADYPAGLSAQGVTTADFNRDGRPDLAAANSGDNTVSVLLGNGDGTFQAARTSATGLGPQSVQSADLNGDGMI